MLRGNSASWCRWGTWCLCPSGPVYVLDDRSRSASGRPWCCVTSGTASGPRWPPGSRTEEKKNNAINHQWSRGLNYRFIKITIITLIDWKSCFLPCPIKKTMYCLLQFHDPERCPHLKTLLQPAEPLKRPLLRKLLHPGFHRQLQADGRKHTFSKSECESCFRVREFVKVGGLACSRRTNLR